jgi:hypothetical protein
VDVAEEARVFSNAHGCTFFVNACSAHSDFTERKEFSLGFLSLALGCDEYKSMIECDDCWTANMPTLCNQANINLSGLHLSYLPACIGNFPIRALDLSNNALSDLPAELGELKKLFSLNLTHNQLRSIPACVMRLKGLESLLLCGNLIQSVGASISDLVNLKFLDLRYNPLDFTRVSLTLRTLKLEVLAVHGISQNPRSPITNLRDLAHWHLQIDALDRADYSHLEYGEYAVAVKLFHLHVLHESGPPARMVPLYGIPFIASLLMNIYGYQSNCFPLPDWLHDALIRCESTLAQNAIKISSAQTDQPASKRSRHVAEDGSPDLKIARVRDDAIFSSQMLVARSSQLAEEAQVASTFAIFRDPVDARKSTNTEHVGKVEDDNTLTTRQDPCMSGGSTCIDTLHARKMKNARKTMAKIQARANRMCAKS